MMKELYRIGNSLAGIAGNAHMMHTADVHRYDRDMQEFREAVRKITAAVVLPERTGLPEETEIWHREGGTG